MKKKINQIFDNTIDTTNYLLASLIAVSLLIRILTVYFIKDTHIEYEWNILLNNLIEHKSYSIFSFNGELVPSVLMPPLYAFFLYFIHTISFLKESYFLDLIFFIQIVLSTYSVYLFYQINKPETIEKKIIFFCVLLFISSNNNFKNKTERKS